MNIVKTAAVAAAIAFLSPAALAAWSAPKALGATTLATSNPSCA